MAKRRGKASQSLASSSGFKRLRENGRLKILDSDNVDEDMQEKILSDAGLDLEQMKSIPDSERQAIIKAITESNKVQDVVMVESSDSTDSKDGTPSAQLGLTESSEDTQPPDGDCPSGDSPNFPNIESPHVLEDRIPSTSVSTGSPKNCRGSGDLDRCVQIGEHDTEMEEKRDEATQPYQLIEEEKSPPILAAETQLSPGLRVEENADSLDVIPESPSTASPDGGGDNERKAVDDEKPIPETDMRGLHRVYPVRSDNSTLQDFLPRFSPGTIKNSTLYTQVIRSMFDIYMRRLQLANEKRWDVPMKWGDPVKTGLSFENLLRRRTLVSGKTENKDGKASGRGRRRILRRNTPSETDSITIVGSECETIERRLAQEKRTVTRRKVEDTGDSGVILDGPNSGCDISATRGVINIDEDSSGDSNDQRVVKKINEVPIPKVDIQENNDQEPVSLPISPNSYTEYGSTERPSKSSGHTWGRKPPPSPQRVNYRGDNNTTGLVPDIEILDEDSSSELKSNPGSWLSTKNSTCKMLKAKSRKESPLVTKSILKRKGKNKDIYQSTISKIFIPIIQENDKIKVCLVEPVLEDYKEVNGTDVGNFGRGAKENNLDEDIPSSVDSSYMLNSQGDMYSTQMTKMKIAGKKNKFEKKVKEMNHSKESVTSDFVTIFSGCKSRLRKRKSCSIEEMENLEAKDTESSISGRVDRLDARTPKSGLRKRKSDCVQEFESLMEPQKELVTISEINSEKSNEKLEIAGLCRSKFKKSETSVFIGGEESLVSMNARKQVKFDVVPDLIDSCHSGSKGKSKKRKKKLFDANSYSCTEQSVTRSGNDLKTKEQNEEDGIPIVDGETDSGGIEWARNQIVTVEEGPSTSSSTACQKEKSLKEGMCPICEKMFRFEQLEAHAATCGEGTAEEEVTATTECMICHKEITTDTLKDHQTKCAHQVVEREEMVVATRMTRAKKSSNDDTRKKTLLREKSLSSSGEDYGELVIEVDQGEK